MSVEQIIKCRNIKAYPSVNSPNDGDFHSEHCSKWFINSIATKPFIIGKTENDIHDSFSVVDRLDDTGNSLLIKNGMFSIGGYVFKLSNENAGNFDKPRTDDDSIIVDSRGLREYVYDLINYGTGNELTSDTNTFLFTPYNPETMFVDGYPDYSSVSSYLARLGDAIVKKTCVGYICEHHSSEFASKISIGTKPVSAAQYIYYKNRKIDVYVPRGITEASTAQDIYAVIGNKMGSEFCVSASDAEKVVFYPVFIAIKDSIPVFTFTDIFGNEYRFNETSVHTKPYPYTQNNLTSMSQNEPLSSVTGFSDCSLTTLSNNIYDFTMLYSNDGERGVTVPAMASYTKTVSGSYGPESIIDYDTGNPLFTKYTIASLANNIPQNVDEFVVNNDLSYYCLTNVPQNQQLSFTNKSGNIVYVPVAFMKSDGSLCSDGFDAETNTDTYPVESYVHFIYRIFDYPETLQELIAKSTFGDVYRQYLAKPMFAYLHMCYNSLFDKVIHASGTSDSQDIKSCGCGVALSGVTDANITSDDYNTYLDYTHTGYVLDGVSLVPMSPQPVTKITYQKDRTSDHYKIKNIHYSDEYHYVFDSNSDSPTSGFSYFPTVDLMKDSTDRTPVEVEDPAFFISNGIKRGTPAGQAVSDIPLYALQVVTNSGQQTVKLVATDINYLDLSAHTIIENGVVSTIFIDETLMPAFHLNDFPMYEVPPIYFDSAKAEVKQTEMSLPANTMSRGIQLGFKTYSWQVAVSQYAKTVMDAQGYLAGSDFTNPQNYLGLQISTDFSDDDSLLLYSVGCFCTATNIYPGNESVEMSTDNTTLTQRKKESIIHVSKIYGDDYKSIEDMIKEQASSIDPDTIDSLVSMITELRNIIGYPYNIAVNNTISYRLNALEDNKDDLTGRIEALEVAVGMPYGEDKESLSFRVDSLESTLQDMSTVLLKITVSSKPRQSPVTISGKSMIISTYDFGITDGVIPANTTIVCRVPLHKDIPSSMFAVGSDTSISSILELPRENSWNQVVHNYGYRTPCNLKYYYAISQLTSMPGDANDTMYNNTVVLMYLQNDGDSDVRLNGFMGGSTAFGLRIVGPLKYSPSDLTKIFDSDGSTVTVELIANSDLPDYDKTYFDYQPE